MLDVFSPGTFCSLGRFVPWDVLSLESFVLETLCLGTFSLCTIFSAFALFAKNHFSLLLWGLGGFNSRNKKCQQISWHCLFTVRYSSVFFLLYSSPCFDNINRDSVTRNFFNHRSALKIVSHQHGCQLQLAIHVNARANQHAKLFIQYYYYTVGRAPFWKILALWLRMANM